MSLYDISSRTTWLVNCGMSGEREFDTEAQAKEYVRRQRLPSHDWKFTGGATRWPHGYDFRCRVCGAEANRQTYGDNDKCEVTT